MPFGLCNASSTFQRCMTSIFSDFLQDCMSRKSIQGVNKMHTYKLVSNRAIEVDKSNIDIITSLPNPASVQEDSTEDLSRISARLPCHYQNCYKRMWTFNLTSPALKPSKI
ncbi:hypothetical protein CR513_00295, partial [Mucuna pruriens]